MGAPWKDKVKVEIVVIANVVRSTIKDWRVSCWQFEWVVDVTGRMVPGPVPIVLLGLGMPLFRPRLCKW